MSLKHLLIAGTTALTLGAIGCSEESELVRVEETACVISGNLHANVIYGYDENNNCVERNLWIHSSNLNFWADYSIPFQGDEGAYLECQDSGRRIYLEPESYRIVFSERED